MYFEGFAVPAAENDVVQSTAEVAKVESDQPVVADGDDGEDEPSEDEDEDSPVSDQSSEDSDEPLDDTEEEPEGKGKRNV